MNDFNTQGSRNVPLDENGNPVVQVYATAEEMAASDARLNPTTGAFTQDADFAEVPAELPTDQ